MDQFTRIAHGNEPEMWLINVEQEQLATITVGICKEWPSVYGLVSVQWCWLIITDTFQTIVEFIMENVTAPESWLTEGLTDD